MTVTCVYMHMPIFLSVLEEDEAPSMQLFPADNSVDEQCLWRELSNERVMSYTPSRHRS